MAKKNTELEMSFCRKTLNNYLMKGNYEQAVELIKLHPNEKQAKIVFLKECYAVMQSMFDHGRPRPREALMLISRVQGSIPSEWSDMLKEKHAHLMTNNLPIKLEGN